MSLLSQLKDLRQQYLTTNSEYLRTPIYIWGCIPDAQDPGKATRRQLIPHYVIHHGLPEQVYDWPDTEAERPGCVSRDEEQMPEDEDVIA
jgi:hypothetical protein